MAMSNLGLKAAIAACLAIPATANAQFNDCTLANSPLQTGADPINHVRLALRQDGRPVLAYSNAVHNNASLYFYDCANPTCSAGQSVYLDTSSNYFGSSGIVIRADGRPAVVASYFGGVRFYDCADADCGSVTVVDIRPTASAILSDIPIALQQNGNPVVLYVDGVTSARPLYLIAHFCTDAGCVAAGSEAVLAIPPAMSGFGALSLAVGSDGDPAATYLTSEGASNLNNYDLARCGDSMCMSVTNTQISAPVGTSTPAFTALAIRSDQRPLALDNQASNTALLDCTTSDCTAVVNRLLPPSAVGQPMGLKLLPGDLPAFALFNPSMVGAFACTDATCSGGASLQTTSPTTSIIDADFAVDSSPHPAIAYIDAGTSDLAIAGCYADLVFANGFE
ncbi:MAG: hypothetical protein P4L92_02915 [Rudaea sp.]|nr:hypothetical protein [Rudaea sp.]